MVTHMVNTRIGRFKLFIYFDVMWYIARLKVLLTKNPIIQQFWTKLNLLHAILLSLVIRFASYSRKRKKLPIWHFCVN